MCDWRCRPFLVSIGCCYCVYCLESPFTRLHTHILCLATLKISNDKWKSMHFPLKRCAFSQFSIEACRVRCHPVWHLRMCEVRARAHVCAETIYVHATNFQLNCIKFVVAKFSSRAELRTHWANSVCRTNDAV